MRKRNELVMLLAMPLALFFWIIGWSLQGFGSNNKRVKPKVRKDGKDLIVMVLMVEQKYAEQSTRVTKDA